ncbi:hypothetical protein A3Q56_02894 [Intoshia linei]|uniref:Uncharacterized protein n=1 Tax=Intoshia linei TaxID=1819745 RepID=A0A177B4Z5_9BILA|nr:hypothetical protein A3Q56_02894 [Intoshia linei]
MNSYLYYFHERPVLVLPENNDITIVTGTSDGFTTFWDIKLGFIKEFSSHKYDVRTISVLKDTVISTGVDAKLVHFKKITNENGFEWIQTFESRRQLFDIFHSIGITDTSVLVAGNGGMVNFVDKESNKIKSVITSIDRFFKVKSVKFTKKGHFVVQTNSKTLELWTLVDKDVSMCVKVDSEIIILNFSVNSTGSLIIYSTIDGMYLISISNTKKQINKSYQIVSNLKFPCFQESCFEYFINFEFLSDNIINENLVAVTLQNDFIIYNAVDSFQIVAKWKFEEQIVNIFVSKFQSIVALLSLTNTVYILSYSTVDKQNMNLKIISKNLFKNDINDLIFHLMDSLVLLEFCNNMIVEFDYKRRKYTKFTQKLLKKYPKTLRKTSTTNFNINYKNHLMYGENSNQILYICGNDEFTFDWEKDELNIVKKHLKFGYYGYINNGTSKVYAITRNRQNMFKSCPEIVYFKKYAQ